MLSLKDGFAVWRQSSSQWYIITMMSGHGPNPVFFNKKNSNWTSRTLTNSHALSPITSNFNLTLSTPSPLKVEVIMCITP